jgi:hypothetical protein
LRIVKGPNVKKLLILATLAAMVGASALPAGATTASGTVTVKWNITVTANLTLNTDYTAAGAQGFTAPSLLLSTGTGGTGEACTNTNPETTATVNFGTITPDSGLAKNTDCLYKNAVDALVQTNSTNWSLGEYNTAALPTGATLCAFGNGYTFPSTTATATVNQSARATYTDNTTCAAGGGNVALTTTSTNNNLVNGATTAFTATAASVTEDMGLMLTPAAATGPQNPTVTFSLIAN